MYYGEGLNNDNGVELIVCKLIYIHFNRANSTLYIYHSTLTARANNSLG